MIWRNFGAHFQLLAAFQQELVCPLERERERVVNWVAIIRIRSTKPGL